MGGIRKRELTAKRDRRDYATAEIVLCGDSDRWEEAHQRGSPFPRPRTTLRAQPPIPSRTGSRDGFTASGKGATNPKTRDAELPDDLREPDATSFRLAVKAASGKRSRTPWKRNSHEWHPTT